jgi:hypothetical protein
MATKTTTTTPDMSAWQSAGRNVKFTSLDGFLFIAVPITNEAIAASPLSASGKNKSVGSTEGNVNLPGTAIKFGVNVFTPPLG